MRPRSRRHGAGAHVLFARSVVFGLSSTVKDHSAVAGSTSTFNRKSLARLMPLSVHTYTHTVLQVRKPTFNTYACGPFPILFVVLAVVVAFISVSLAKKGPSVVTAAGDI